MERLSVETITPALAADWLKSNAPYNRKIRHAWVAELVKSITDGKWVTNGESIVFDEDGFLIDGQHRLSAVVEAGIPIRSVVVRDVSRDSFKNTGSGHRRTGADRLSFIEVSNATTHAGGIRGYLLSKKYRSLYTVETRGGTKGAKTVADYEIIEFYNNHNDLCDRVCFIINSLRHKSNLLSPSELYSMCLLLIIDKGHSEQKVFSFFSQVTTGRDVENETILTLRDKLIAHKTRLSVMSADEKRNAIIKTWNAYVTGKTLKSLRLIPDTYKSLDFI